MATAKPATHADVCGTEQGRRRHRRLGQELCPLCDLSKPISADLPETRSQVRVAECAVCERTFETQHATKVYCGDVCSAEARRRRKRKKK